MLIKQMNGKIEKILDAKKETKREKARRIAVRKKQQLKEWMEYLKDDEDYDFAFILAMLEYKLSRVRQCILTNGLVANAQEIATEIQEVETLLNRVTNFDYLTEAKKNFEKKYGKPTWKETQVEGGLEIQVLYKGLPSTKKMNRELSTVYQKSEKMRVKDLEKALALMAKNIWGWWD